MYVEPVSAYYILLVAEQVGHHVLQIDHAEPLRVMSRWDTAPVKFDVKRYIFYFS